MEKNLVWTVLLVATSGLIHSSEGSEGRRNSGRTSRTILGSGVGNNLPEETEPGHYIYTANGKYVVKGNDLADAETGVVVLKRAVEVSPEGGIRYLKSLKVGRDGRISVGEDAAGSADDHASESVSATENNEIYRQLRLMGLDVNRPGRQVDIRINSSRQNVIAPGVVIGGGHQSTSGTSSPQKSNASRQSRASPARSSASRQSSTSPARSTTSVQSTNGSSRRSSASPSSRAHPSAGTSTTSSPTTATRQSPNLNQSSHPDRPDNSDSPDRANRSAPRRVLNLSVNSMDRNVIRRGTTATGFDAVDGEGNEVYLPPGTTDIVLGKGSGRKRNP